MDSLDHLLSPRISWIFGPEKLTLEVDAERVEWPLNKDTSIPNKDVTSFIHLDTVETENCLWGLFMPNKSYLFYVSILVIYSDTFELHKDPSVSFLNAKISSFGGAPPFLQVFSILQNWTKFFLQRETWAYIKVINIRGSGS